MKTSTRNGMVRIWILFAVSAAILLAPFVRQFLPQGKEERSLLNALEQKLGAEDDTVSLQRLAPFEWDRTCLIYGEYVPVQELGLDASTARQIEKYAVNLLFFDDGRLVEMLNFRGNPRVSIAKTRYRFARFVGDACVERSYAALQAAKHSSPHGDDYQIQLVTTAD